MRLKEPSDRPRNKEFILLDTVGDIHNPVVLPPRKYYQAIGITNITCLVYNDNTNKVSNNPAYIDKEGRLYLKTKGRGRLYIDEFK